MLWTLPRNEGTEPCGYKHFRFLVVLIFEFIYLFFIGLVS